MPTLTEQFESRLETIEEENPRAERVYLVDEASDESEVKAIIQAQVPAWHGLLEIKSVELEERLTPTAWRVRVRYEKPAVSVAEPDITTLKETSFDVTTSPKHITRSIKTLAFAGPGATSNTGGVIGYDGQTVHGVDVLEAAVTLSVVKRVPKANIGVSFRNLIASFVGTTNQYAWAGFAAGEVLMTGLSGSTKTEHDYWELTFTFAVRFNVPATSIGGYTVQARPGWSYLWIRYASRVVDDQIVKTPVAFYTEQIYPESNWVLPGGVI